MKIVLCHSVSKWWVLAKLVTLLHTYVISNHMFMFIIFDNSVIYVRLYICIASYVANIVKYYMWLDLWKPIQITQELKSFYYLTLKLHSTAISIHAKHMAKDGQVCFHRSPFVKPVNLQKCITEPVKPLDGTNKDVSGAKLQLTTTSVCHVLWIMPVSVLYWRHSTTARSMS